jgi:hypothetical protein
MRTLLIEETSHSSKNALKLIRLISNFTEPLMQKESCLKTINTPLMEVNNIMIRAYFRMISVESKLSSAFRLKDNLEEICYLYVIYSAF